MEETFIVPSLIIASFVFALPLLLVLTSYKWWRAGRALRAIRKVLGEGTGTSDTAEKAAKKLLAAKKTLEASVEHLERRFAGVLDIERETTKLIEQRAALDEEIERLRSNYHGKKQVFDRLIAEVAIFDERLAFAEMGFYEPHFEFTDSEEYKMSIAAAREQQKSLTRSEHAVVCTTKWAVDGSASRGQTMTKRNIRLTLRAFNNECDAAIANARWNNVNAMEKRIVRAQEQIDKLNASNSIFVTGEFLKLKLQELYLTHEYREKLKAEREERAEAARLAREEQRLLRDMEEAQAEERHYAALLAKAKAEAASIVGPQLHAFSEQIALLERDLVEAHAKAERAQSLAERTRSGYVYILSPT